MRRIEGEEKWVIVVEGGELVEAKFWCKNFISDLTQDFISICPIYPRNELHLFFICLKIYFFIYLFIYFLSI